ncbi:LysM peptidoglycan-binding domain-containing protein [Sinomonas gamaensis]|uniref:LysM peptidoglycan-binding domain-containing protein n=1 Tax=Sinomonas gamaensis TaxID=2565624 RepID=UPI001485D5F3|nr:LysM domain-containing protein [Sinomonas gamaensis]
MLPFVRVICGGRRSPAWTVSVILLAVLLAGCSAPPQPSAESVSPAPSASPAPSGPAPLSGKMVADSWNNDDFYTPVSTDTLAGVAAYFHLSAARLAQFNGMSIADPLTPGKQLRLIPPPDPTPGAMGKATYDANGIPIEYVVAEKDTTGGLEYRFGLTLQQLAEANRVDHVYEQGNVYYLQPGRHMWLQKNPVDSRSGRGTSVNNSFGQTIYYTTVDGDSFDSLGYKFRCATDQLLRWNTTLTADRPIPAGTKVRLIPSEVTVEGAQGSFTADADGIPLTYTTAPGDTERQIAFRFGVPEIADLEGANRPLTGTDRVWYTFADLPSGELNPGQTISLNLTKPIHK